MNLILLVCLVEIIESKKHLRIIGGRNAEENEYSYAARVEILIIDKDKMYVTNRAHVCTSAILTPVWTLTAAHCVHDMNKLLKTIEYMDNKSKNTELVLTRDIKAVVWFGNVRDQPSNTFSDIIQGLLHPAAKFGLMNAYPQNDVGLFRTQPITIKQYAKVSALDPLSMRGHKVHVVGYGLTNSSYGKIDNTLVLKRPLQILTVMITTCPGKIIYPALCIARACGVSTTVCPGDSGGPVLHPSGVVAVNTMAILSDCFVSSDDERTYNVGTLTPIGSYIDWLYHVININSTGV